MSLKSAGDLKLLGLQGVFQNRLNVAKKICNSKSLLYIDQYPLKIEFYLVSIDLPNFLCRSFDQRAIDEVNNLS